MPVLYGPWAFGLRFACWVFCFGFMGVSVSCFQWFQKANFGGLRYFIGGQVLEANGLWVQSLGLWHSSQVQVVMRTRKTLNPKP